MDMAGPSHLLSVLQLIHQGTMAGGQGCAGSCSLAGLCFPERGNKILHHPRPVIPDQRHFSSPAERGLLAKKRVRAGCAGTLLQLRTPGKCHWKQLSAEISG